MAVNHFSFSESQYDDFYQMLKQLNTVNWGTWNTREWLRFEGMPDYSINQYQQDNGKQFVVVKFDSMVKLPDGRKGKRFKVGGQRNYQPVCEYF